MELDVTFYPFSRERERERVWGVICCSMMPLCVTV